MPFRYRILPFGADQALKPSELLAAVWSTSGAPSHPPGTPQWADLVQHLSRAGARSLLVQDHVRDPDFMEEYEAVYSKQHRDMPRFCVRVHAFAKDSPTNSNQPDAILKFIDEAAKETSYLGFVTLRPLRYAPVGASILVDAPGFLSLCKDRFPVHIAGATFHVLGTPYLQQDSTVGACAQASIWMALRTVRRRSGGSAYSPAELTIAATQYMAFDRVFPGRRGLTVEQMLAAIRASDHDPLVISLREKDKNTGKPFTNPYTAMERIQPYIESGLPAIVLLEHESGGHAVVGIGLAPGVTSTLTPPGVIIHNDNQGPYRLLPFSDPAGGYALTQCASVIVPLPQGVLMPAEEAERQAYNLLEFWHGVFAKDAGQVKAQPKDLWVRTYLCTRHAFRNWARTSVLLDSVVQSTYRTTEMPKLVWVMEVHDAGAFDPGNVSKPTRLGEVVLDAAADALHGDALVFLRLGQDMLAVESKFPGLLAFGDGGMLPLATSPACEGISEPWDHL